MEMLRNLNFFRLITSGDFWVSIVIICVSTILLYLAITKTIMFSGQRIKRWSTGKHSALYQIAVEMLDNTKRILILFTAILISMHFIELPGAWQSALSHGWFLVFAIQIALWLDSACTSGRRTWSTSREPRAIPLPWSFSA